MELTEVSFDDDQITAIRRCCDISPNNRIVPVTGPAGVGKTRILQKVHDLLADAGYRVVLVAPTGKAAKRIYEATGIPAMTIHRVLEYPHPGERDPKTGKPLLTTEPKRHRSNPLEYDVVLGDEYAMVNWEVHNNLLAALPTGGCLRVFGDVNQLPPIEKDKRLWDQPSPFMTLLHKFKGTFLSHVYRHDGGIAANGSLILKGRVPRRNDQWSMKITDYPVDALVEFLDDNYTFDFSDVACQIIVPSRKTWIGTAKLNVVLQQFYRPENDGWIALPRHPWALDQHTRIRDGDKVIWTENDYNLEIFNGETGIVCEAEQETGEFSIDLGDRTVHIPPVVLYESVSGVKSYDPRCIVDLAYAITTHKAQGSEYKYVVYMINKSCSFMQNRNNFYTATMRAREYVHVISDQRSLQYSTWKRHKQMM